MNEAADVGEALATLHAAGYRLVIERRIDGSQPEGGEFLTVAELIVLTGRAHRARQERELLQMGMPFRVSPTGRLLVSRHHVRDWLGGKQPAKAVGFDLGKIK